MGKSACSSSRNTFTSAKRIVITHMSEDVLQRASEVEQPEIVGMQDTAPRVRVGQHDEKQRREYRRDGSVPKPEEEEHASREREEDQRLIDRWFERSVQRRQDTDGPELNDAMPCEAQPIRKANTEIGHAVGPNQNAKHR